MLAKRVPIGIYLKIFPARNLFKKKKQISLLRVIQREQFRTVTAPVTCPSVAPTSGAVPRSVTCVRAKRVEKTSKDSKYTKVTTAV
jgi:hypothetical protein